MRYQPTAEYRYLLEAACTGELTVSQVQRLEAIFRADPAAQDYYLRYLMLDADLALELGGAHDAALAAANDPAAPATLPMAAPRRRRLVLWVAASAALAATVLLAIGLGGWLTRPTPSLLDVTAIATLAESSGIVELVSVSGEIKAALKGQAVQPGETVRTGAGESWAVVEFRDSSRLELDAETELRLDDGRRLFLAEGSVRANVRDQPTGRHVELATRHARIKARGNRFSSSASDDSTRVEAESGPMEVQRGAERPIELEAGFYAVVAANTDSVVVRAQPAPSKLARVELAGPSRALAFTPDGSVLLTLTSHAVVSWDARSGMRQASFDVGQGMASLALLPDGTLLTAGKGPLIRFWNRIVGQQVRSLDTGAAGIRQLVVSPDGRLLAALAADDAKRSEVQIWKLERGERLLALDGETSDDNCLAFAPDSRGLVVGRPGGRVVLHNLPGDKRQAAWKAHNKHLHCLAFARDGRLVTTGQDGMIRVWDAATHQKRAEVCEPGRKALALAVSPDDRWVATTHADGLRLWPLSGGEPRLLVLGRKKATLLAFSPDSSRLAVAAFDKPAQLWNLSELAQSR